MTHTLLHQTEQLINSINAPRKENRVKSSTCLLLQPIRSPL